MYESLLSRCGAQTRRNGTSTDAGSNEAEVGVSVAMAVAVGVSDPLQQLVHRHLLPIGAGYERPAAAGAELGVGIRQPDAVVPPCTEPDLAVDGDDDGLAVVVVPTAETAFVGFNAVPFTGTTGIVRHHAGDVHEPHRPQLLGPGLPGLVHFDMPCAHDFSFHVSQGLRTR